jgi:phenylalanyl-tRNA synthetase beta chain
MNVSYRWLQSLVPGLAEPPQDLAHRLSLLGAPADEVVDLGAGVEGVVIGRVLEVWQHPNADKLRVTRVDAGGDPSVRACRAGSRSARPSCAAKLPRGCCARRGSWGWGATTRG